MDKALAAKQTVHFLQRRSVKGPYLRLRFDFRRRWECPVCHARARSAGDVTSMPCAACAQAGKAACMRMVYDGERMLRWRPQSAVASVAAPAAEIPGDQRESGEPATAGERLETPQQAPEPGEIPSAGDSSQSLPAIDANGPSG